MGDYETRLKAKDAEIESKDRIIGHKDVEIESKDRTLGYKDRIIGHKDAEIVDLEYQLDAPTWAFHNRNEELVDEIKDLQHEIATLKALLAGHPEYTALTQQIQDPEDYAQAKNEEIEDLKGN